MGKSTSPRIESIDLLRGIVMVVMALDHVRDYFHYSVHFYEPTDINKTTLAIFFTRWITHFCAPSFSFLAGTSAFFISRKKTAKQLSAFLLKRGLWLMALDATVITFAWLFDFQFHIILLITIWSLGASMVFLSGLVFLPSWAIAAIGLIIVSGHNAFDNLHFNGNPLWAFLHDGGAFQVGHSIIMFGYPVLPWAGVMALGYSFGVFYTTTYDASKRRRTLNVIGLLCIALFAIFIALNSYGNPRPWVYADTPVKTFMSMMNPEKYPPSLWFVLMTLGPSILFLANAEKLSGRIVSVFSTIGRVPFFYYILHLFLIHALAMLAAQLTGFHWSSMILTDNWVGETKQLQGYGFSLSVVYLVWVAVVVMLYPFCVWYDRYKTNHKDKWWLGYL